MNIERLIHKYFLLNHPFFKTSADDTLKWMPLGLLFLLDLFGTKTKSGWQKQVLVAAGAQSIRFLIADNLKKITHEHRPAPHTGNHSFPSGHTTTAFSTAEILHSELKDSYPLLSYSGYLTATAVAAIRIMKNKHWLKDVVAGAAIGIIATKTAYAIVNRLSRSQKSNIKVDKTKEQLSDHVLATT